MIFGKFISRCSQPNLHAAGSFVQAASSGVEDAKLHALFSD
jgi:hypothetical protein